MVVGPDAISYTLLTSNRASCRGPHDNQGVKIGLQTKIQTITEISSPNYHVEMEPFLLID